jgi:hypothetical protein
MIEMVRVLGGRGRWAYWSDREKKEVVADDICQAQKPHFAGMLNQVVTSPGTYEMKVGGFMEERPGSVFDVEEE